MANDSPQQAAAAPLDPNFVRDLLYAWLYVTVSQMEAVTAPAPAGTDEGAQQAAIAAQLQNNLSSGNHVNIGPLAGLIAGWVADMRTNQDTVDTYTYIASRLRASGRGSWGGPGHPPIPDLDASFVPTGSIHAALRGGSGQRS